MYRQHGEHEGRGRAAEHGFEREGRRGAGGPFGRRQGPWQHGRGFGGRRFWFGRGGGRGFGGRGPWGGGPSGGDGGDGGGGRRRQRRGDIKFALLALLAEQPRHGYDLIKALEQRYAGFYRPSPGSVYPTLQLLEDEGSIVGEAIDGKRVYTITDAGRQALTAHEQRAAQQPDGGWRGFGRTNRPDLEALQRGSMALMHSVMEAARHGTPDQQRAVLERLEATRREVYRILAQDDQTRMV